MWPFSKSEEVQTTSTEDAPKDMEWRYKGGSGSLSSITLKTIATYYPDKGILIIEDDKGVEAIIAQVEFICNRNKELVTLRVISGAVPERSGGG